jgi:hypothetical protein
MSEDQMKETQQPDAFEAALAANATEISTPVVEEIVMKMATSNQMRMIQMQSSVAHCAPHLAIGM